jgi:polyhydroxybutyrate depolymerase
MRLGCALVLASCVACSSEGVRSTPDAALALDASVAPLPSEGCTGPAAYLPGTTVGTLTMAGERTFRVHVPPGPAGIARPLVLMFHGGGGSGRQFELNSAGMDPIADREDFITVYPDGLGALKTWNGGGCCGYAVENQVDDVGFVVALLDQLERQLCVDRRRVFATGMSNGAVLSHRLACELADRLAAVAPVSGTDMTSRCTPSRAIPLLQIHGTADGHVPFRGGQGCGPTNVSFTSVPETISRWRTRNGCGEGSSVTFTQGEGSCTSYAGCRADVTLCSIEGGGHNWPGGEPPADLVPCPGNGFQSASFVASEVIWRFFAAHPRE